MKDKIIEQKRILKLRCYKWAKFHQSDSIRAACPWGYEEINEMCKNCRWFDIQKVTVNGEVVVTDREISHLDVPLLAAEYKAFDKVIDVQAAEDAMKAEEDQDRGLH